MDYDRIYGDLIWRGIERSEGWRNKKKREGYERHHIVPKCMGGGDEPENLVLLTIREHFVAHRLLTKIYPGNLGLFQAVFFMSRTREGVRIVSSRGFSDLRGVIEGTAVYTNGEGRTMRFLTGSVPEGYFGVCAGTAVYSDGRGVRRFRAGYQPEGWCHISKGTALYKDEEGNIKRFQDGLSPLGWWKTSEKTVKYCKGGETKRFPEGRQPEGWSRVVLSEDSKNRSAAFFRGENNPRRDNNLYSFRNTRDGSLELGVTRKHMVEKYGLGQGKLGSLVSGKKKKYKGWVIFPEPSHAGG